MSHHLCTGNLRNNFIIRFDVFVEMRSYTDVSWSLGGMLGIMNLLNDTICSHIHVYTYMTSIILIINLHEMMTVRK